MSKPLIGPDRLPVPCQYPGCVWRSTNGSRCADHDGLPFPGRWAPKFDAHGCPDAPHLAVDCPGDACRHAAEPLGGVVPGANGWLPEEDHG